MATMYHTL